ncbi:hypothetical protein EJ357_23650 [Streptomyces cyaneochromogenes]|uniref:Uncharacterized protein n=1 Tax=Streptomyces cyaneochromogenes TaxID=2496836 RepID=A0A3S9MAI3_9ACTN|nr:hypothetical protein EJ357_23650 [Streptomyces cyaneochromogenes]
MGRGWGTDDFSPPPPLPVPSLGAAAPRPPLRPEGPRPQTPDGLKGRDRPRNAGRLRYAVRCCVDRPCPCGAYGVTVKLRRIAVVRPGSPSAFTRSATASGVTRPQARRT